MSHWTALIVIVFVLGAMGVLVAGVLALRLLKRLPDLHKDVDAPTGHEWTPFWALHFLSPSKWRRLPASYKPWMLLSIFALVSGVVLFLVFLFRFAAGGSV